MIEKTSAYKASDGQIYDTLPDCQKHEIQILWKEDGAEEVAIWVMENAVKIVDVLTTTPSSKPKARKANGGTKVRKPKTAPEPSTPPVA